MIHRILTTLLLWTLVLAGTHSFAAESDQVAVTVPAFQFVGAGKDQHLAPTVPANPGDVEYQIIYRNAGSAAAKRIKASLPVPAGGMVHREGSASPGLQASLDGVNYAAPLLKREDVRDGRRPATKRI